MSPLTERARRFIDAGIGVLSVRTDGTKRPTLPEWAFLQGRFATLDEITDWFNTPAGIALVCGGVSGNLEALDIDAPSLVDEWIMAVGRLHAGLVERLVYVETPTGGAHFWYRHMDAPMGNKKLAQELRTDDNGRPRPYTLIETRGQGGYAIAPGSPAACHTTGRTYDLKRGSFGDVPRLTIGERLCLLDAARGLGTWTPPAPIAHFPRGEQSGDRPGDVFNAEARWDIILGPHGWRVDHAAGDETFWRRPGKGDGQSATTGYAGSNVLYVFSSNAYPFEPEQSYTPFAAYALLEHGGDYQAAARALKGKGYGAAPRAAVGA